MILIPTFAIAGTSHYPNGIVVGTKAQEATATVTPGAGDLFVPGTS